MSYYGADVNGYLGDAASNGGWADFTKWARAQGDPALTKLADEGWAEAPALMAALAGHRATGTVDLTRLGLLTLARKAEDILLVSDGVGVE
jgi:hypothetical protein